MKLRLKLKLGVGGKYGAPSLARDNIGRGKFLDIGAWRNQIRTRCAVFDGVALQ
jgi:hypothetical protein